MRCFRMIAIVTIEGNKHIYNIYACMQCDNNKVLLRVSHCCLDIVVYDVPASIIDFYISQVKNTACFDLTKYTCKILEPINNTYNEQNEDEYMRELLFQESQELEK